MNTHEFLHKHGLALLEYDLKNNVDFSRRFEDDMLRKLLEKYDEFKLYYNSFIENATYPDRKENFFVWEVRDEKVIFPKVKIKKIFKMGFIGHFYSLESNKSYMNFDNSITDFLVESRKKNVRDIGYQIKKQGLHFNALNLFEAYITSAAQKLEDNNYMFNEEIVAEVSRGLHYLEDMCETHHVTNKTAMKPLFIFKLPYIKYTKYAIKYNHGLFEEYANRQKEKYILKASSEFSNIESLMKEEQCFWREFDYYFSFFNYETLMNTKRSECIRKICHFYAVNFNSFSSGRSDLYGDDVRANYRVACVESNNSTDWDINIEQTLKIAQVAVSVVIYTMIFYASYPNLFDFPLKD